MAATTGFRAGFDTTAMRIGILQEAVWGTPAAGKYRDVRWTGESFTQNVTRQRPPEKPRGRQAQRAVTTEKSAGGSINYGLSYGTYDDVLAGLFCGDWNSNILVPSDIFHSYTLEKMLSPTVGFQFPGTFWTGATLSVARGQFLNGAFTGASKRSNKLLASVSTGGTYDDGVLTDVMDPVSGITDIFMDGVAIAGVPQSVSLNIRNEGAGMDYGIGSAEAQGVRMGTFMADGTVEVFFRDFALYDRADTELHGAFSFVTKDPTGNKYRFTCPDSVVVNPQVVAQGPNQTLVARYTLECGYHSTGTVRLERIPAA